MTTAPAAPSREKDPIGNFISRLGAIPATAEKRIWSVCARELTYVRYGDWVAEVEPDPETGHNVLTRRTRISDYCKAIREAFGATSARTTIALKYFRLKRDEAAGVRADYEAQVYDRHHNLLPIDAEEIVTRAKRDLHDARIARRIAAVIALTGRRLVEVVLTGSFTPKGDGLLFDGQAKTRQAASARTYEYRIPCLADPRAIVNAIDGIRSDIGLIEGRDGKTAEEIAHDRFASNVARAIRKPPDDAPPIYTDASKDRTPLSPATLRAAYATIAYTRLAPETISPNAYFAAILGHSEGDFTTGLSYFKFYALGHKRDLETDLRRGLRAAIANLERQAQSADAITKDHLTSTIAQLRGVIGKES